MNLTDIFIKRPVLATVVSLLILVIGIRSAMVLSVREFPFLQNAIITVQTPFIGADPEVVSSFITTMLEQVIAQSNGIDYMTSSSSQGVSTILVYLRTNYDTDKSITEITAYVDTVTDQLPPGSQLPQITVDVGEATDLMYMGFYSDVLSRNAINDYIIRVIQPKVRSVHGVLDAEIVGLRQFAARIWLDPHKLAAYGLTANDIYDALTNNDALSAVGRTDGQMIAVNMTINTNLTSIDEFKDLVVNYENGAIVKLSDVATVSLGSQDYDSSVSFNTPEGIHDAIYVGVQVVPDGNVLTVIEDVKQAFYQMQAELPEGLEGKIVYDATNYIHASIHEVLMSLFEALVIVTLIIFVFLGTVRSVSIPVVAIPLSLIGTFLMMFIFGYSINILTLLALVLAIGLVVDDAIIIVENTDRHIKEGMSPFDAAIQCGRELANPIVAITIVLIAVYLPIGFMGGLTGKLFTEFAFTLAGAVGISAIIALTLSPMMCSKLLKPVSEDQKNRFSRYLDRHFENLHQRYRALLSESLNHKEVTAVFAGIVIVSMVVLFMTSKSELAPDEDQGLILSQLMASPNASVHQTKMYADAFYQKVKDFPEIKSVFQFDGATGQSGLPDVLNESVQGFVLKPWDERKRTANDLVPLMQAKADTISGSKIALYQPSPLPGTVGMPIQFAIVTTENYKKLYDVSSEFINAVEKTGLFSYIDNDLKLDMLQVDIEIDRIKAAQLGLQMSDIGDAMSAALSQQYVNFFDLDGRSYQVIPQMNRESRLNYDQVLDYYINTSDGQMVPLSTVATLKKEVVPESLNHFQQLNSATISAIPNSGVMMGTAISALEKLAKEILPAGYDVDYGGESRQFEQESNALLITFLFSMLIIFLSLSALFESFRDPVIIMISVPMSIFGALLFINLGIGGASLNIYSEVGLVTLIGLISKHGILIVQFANSLQMEGKDKLEAIITAAGIRLRPIIMTSGAMVIGVVPLIIATGAGAESRFNIGLVIASGISIGTLFTLFVVPAMYMFMANVRVPEKIVASPKNLGDSSPA